MQYKDWEFGYKKLFNRDSIKESKFKVSQILDYLKISETIIKNPFLKESTYTPTENTLVYECEINNKTEKIYFQFPDLNSSFPILKVKCQGIISNCEINMSHFNLSTLLDVLEHWLKLQLYFYEIKPEDLTEFIFNARYKRVKDREYISSLLEKSDTSDIFEISDKFNKIYDFPTGLGGTITDETKLLMNNLKFFCYRVEKFNDLFLRMEYLHSQQFSQFTPFELLKFLYIYNELDKVILETKLQQLTQ